MPKSSAVNVHLSIFELIISENSSTVKRYLCNCGLFFFQWPFALEDYNLKNQTKERSLKSSQKVSIENRLIYLRSFVSTALWRKTLRCHALLVFALHESILFLLLRFFVTPPRNSCFWTELSVKTCTKSAPNFRSCFLVQI